jgi:hypothetical protein
MDAPIYVPLIASEGVLNPRPTSLYHLFSFVAIFLPASRILHENIHINVGTRTHHEVWHFGISAASGKLFQSVNISYKGNAADYKEHTWSAIMLILRTLRAARAQKFRVLTVICEKATLELYSVRQIPNYR